MFVEQRVDCLAFREAITGDIDSHAQGFRCDEPIPVHLTRWHQLHRSGDAVRGEIPRVLGEAAAEEEAQRGIVVRMLGQLCAAGVLTRPDGESRDSQGVGVHTLTTEILMSSSPDMRSWTSDLLSSAWATIIVRAFTPDLVILPPSRARHATHP